VIFCDTSALAKYYVPEAESAALASRLDAEDAVSFLINSNLLPEPLSKRLYRRKSHERFGL
jgi:predicted nucleic acid-binding protein